MKNNLKAAIPVVIAIVGLGVAANGYGATIDSLSAPRNEPSTSSPTVNWTQVYIGIGIIVLGVGTGYALKNAKI